MKAFEVTVSFLPDVHGFYAALNAGKARYHAYASALDASFNVKFSDFKVRRAPQYDAIAMALKPGIARSIGWRDEFSVTGCCSESA